MIDVRAELYFRNKIKRQILWDGQNFKFFRYKKNEYNEITDVVENMFCFKGLFHEGGGYGGMLNIELYERDGSRTVTKMKPMILCLIDETTKQIRIGDYVIIGTNLYQLVDKVDIKNFGIAYEISLEIVKDEL